MELLIDPFGGTSIEWAALPLRLTLGFVFVVSGGGKFRRGIGGTGRWLEGLGFPFPQAMARGIATLELGGGLLLLVGLFVPLMGVLFTLHMLGATWTQRFKLHAPFQGGDVQGYELDVLMMAIAVALVLLGAGPLSLDAMLAG